MSSRGDYENDNSWYSSKCRSSAYDYKSKKKNVSGEPTTPIPTFGYTDSDDAFYRSSRNPKRDQSLLDEQHSFYTSKIKTFDPNPDISSKRDQYYYDKQKKVSYQYQDPVFQTDLQPRVAHRDYDLATRQSLHPGVLKRKSDSPQRHSTLRSKDLGFSTGLETIEVSDDEILPSELVKAKNMKRGSEWIPGILDNLLELGRVRDDFRLIPAEHGMLKTLKPNEALDLGIITLWTKHILRSLSITEKNKLHILPSNFYTIITGSAYQFQIHGKRDIPRLFPFLAIETLMIPIHIQFHWLLVVVNMKRREMTIYNSLDNYEKYYDQIFKNIAEWLDNTCMDQSGIHCMFDENVAVSVPKQNNSLDCGIFVCMYMSYLCSKIQFDFKQKDIELLRLWMCHELGKEI